MCVCPENFIYKSAEALKYVNMEYKTEKSADAV